jgi:23S rRNA pseudouridine955/2504/2580 synthase
MKTPVQHITVTAAEAGQKLLQYLVRRLGPDLPQAALQKCIRTGQVRLDGKRCKPFDRVAEGQIVRVPPFEVGDDPAASGPAAGTRAGNRPAADGQTSHGPTFGGEPSTSPAQRAPGTLPASRGKPGVVPPQAQTPPTSQPPRAGKAKPRPRLDILHEDDELLVVVKPAGLPVHPGSGHPFALTTLLHEHCPDAPFRPTPAHRLDRDTTGVLLVAKSYRCLRNLHEAMLAGTARKDYLTWVWGRWLLGEENEWLVLRDVLAKTGGPGQERVAAGEQGKEAVAKVRLIGTAPTASLLEVRLETGRTHQIRAQLASRGYPIVGDAKYGGGAPPMRLHAWRVTLPEAAFCVPPAWEAPWTVTRPRRASLAECYAE